MRFSLNSMAVVTIIFFSFSTCQADIPDDAVKVAGELADRCQILSTHENSLERTFTFSLQFEADKIETINYAVASKKGQSILHGTATTGETFLYACQRFLVKVDTKRAGQLVIIDNVPYELVLASQPDGAGIHFALCIKAEGLTRVELDLGTLIRASLRKTSNVTFNKKTRTIVIKAKDATLEMIMAPSDTKGYPIEDFTIATEKATIRVRDIRIGENAMDTQLHVVAWEQIVQIDADRWIGRMNQTTASEQGMVLPKGFWRDAKVSKVGKTLSQVIAAAKSQTAMPSPATRPTLGDPMSNELDRNAAIAAARRAIGDKLRLPGDDLLEAVLVEGKWIVTWNLPPAPANVARGDYTARVTLDARTGKVLSLLSGS